MTESGRQSRVVLDVRSLLGSVLGGDFASVLDTARLTIASGGTEQTLTRRFGPGDSEVTFDVNVEPGPATFELDVISDSGVVLYQGETNTTIDADGFAVTITPQAVSGVMVAYPRRPSFDTLTTIQGTLDFEATLNLRNAGSAALTWNVDSLPGPALAMFCFIPSLERNCFRSTAWASTEDRIVVVTYRISRPGPAVPAAPTVDIKFASTVGSATVSPVP